LGREKVEEMLIDGMIFAFFKVYLMISLLVSSFIHPFSSVSIFLPVSLYNDDTGSRLSRIRLFPS